MKAAEAAPDGGFAAHGGLAQPALVPGLAEAVDRALAQDGVPQVKLTASDGAGQARFGRAVAIQGDTAVVTAMLADVGSNPLQGAAYVFTRDGDGWTETQKLTASDGGPFERFGGSLAIDGDTLLVGSWGASAERGAVYVFVRDASGTWTEQAKLTAPDGQPNDFFGDYVDLDGDTAVIGASGVDGESPNFEQGAAYVSTRTGTSWSQPERLPATGGTRNDQFGHGVAIDGDTILVGVPFAEVGEHFDQGAVDVFTRTGDGWQPAGRITAADGMGIDRFGFSVALQDDTAVIGAIGAEYNGVNSPGATYVFTRDGAGWTQQAKLGASDAAEFDNFGDTVAIDGNRIVVAANFATVGDHTWQGAAYVFERSGQTWSELAKLAADDGQEFDDFGSNAVAIDGGSVLVGAQNAMVNGEQAHGAAWVFELDGGGGPGTTTLVAADGAADDWFGRAVAIDGDTALVGADAADVAGTFNQGAVYVFVRDGDGWTQQAKLVASDGGQFDQFGISVALDGDTALIGTAGEAAYVFTRTGSSWTEQAKLTVAESMSGFGIDVALASDTALVGAREADVDGRINQGAAYVFVRDGDSWTQQAKLVASDGAAFDVFGDAIALTGNTAVVGAAFADPGGRDGAGAAWVFTRAGDSWTERAKLVAGDSAAGDWFGSAVAVAGDTVLVGATLDDGGRGAAYAFTRTGDSWTEQAKLVASDGAAGDGFGNAIALRGNAALIGAWFDDGGIGSAYAFVRDGGSWAEQARLVADGRAAADQFGNAVAIDGDTGVVGAWLTDVAGNSDQGVAHVYQLDVPSQAPPQIVVEPASLSVSLAAGEATTESVTIGNLGEAELAWSVEPAAPGCAEPGSVGWLEVAPATGATPGGGSSELTVSIDAAGLAAGDYRAALCVESNDPADPVVEVPVALTVAAVVCDETISGVHAGPLTVSEGVTCLAAGAQVLGEVNVQAGAGLVGTAAVIQGPVSALGAATVELRFSQVTGPVLV
ncbi:MAG TPA: hypothetical protein VIL37_17345, partial [Natronosporangium sp.]